MYRNLEIILDFANLGYLQWFTENYPNNYPENYTENPTSQP